MAERGGYQGYGLQPIDDKGRVAIPAALRTTLIANTPAGGDGKGAGTIVVSTHQREKCLIGYDPGFADLLQQRLTQREDSYPLAGGEVDYNIKRRGIGAAEATPFDASGRFILPAFPRFHAGITRHAFFFGVLDYFEIWDPATLIACEDAPEVMKSAARFFAAEKGIAL